jgi:hypothetical protein
MTFVTGFVLGGATVYFWPWIKTQLLAAYDWAVSKI